MQGKFYSLIKTNIELILRLSNNGRNQSSYISDGIILGVAGSLATSISCRATLIATFNFIE